MKPRGLHRRWWRTVHQTLAGVNGSLDALRTCGSAEAVHALRVAIRRARLYVRMGRPFLDAEQRDRFNLWGRSVNEALGPLRDCDVAMNWVAAQTQALVFLESLTLHRAALWETARRRLQALDSLRPEFPVAPAGRDTRLLLKRFRRALRRARSDVRRLAPRVRNLCPDQRHELRRFIRRWRYLRELGLPAGGKARDARLKQLNRAQDVLGELQNLRVTVLLLDRLGSPETTSKLHSRLRRDSARLKKGCPKKLKPLLSGKT